MLYGGRATLQNYLILSFEFPVWFAAVTNGKAITTSHQDILYFKQMINSLFLLNVTQKVHSSQEQ